MVGWWFDFLYGILFYLKDIEGSFLIFWIELTNEPKPVQKINSITKLQNIIIDTIMTSNPIPDQMLRHL